MSEKKVKVNKDLQAVEKIKKDLQKERNNPRSRQQVIDDYLDDYGNLRKYRLAHELLLILTLPLFFALFFLAFFIQGVIGNILALLAMCIFVGFPVAAFIVDSIATRKAAPPDELLIFRLCYLSKMLEKYADDRENKSLKKRSKDFALALKIQLVKTWIFTPLIYRTSSGQPHDRIRLIYYKLVGQYITQVYRDLKKKKFARFQVFSQDLLSFSRFVSQGRCDEGVSFVVHRNRDVIDSKKKGKIKKCLVAALKPVPPEERKTIPPDIEEAVIWFLSFGLAWVIADAAVNHAATSSLYILQQVKTDPRIYALSYIGTIAIIGSIVRKFILSVGGLQGTTDREKERDQETDDKTTNT